MIRFIVFRLWPALLPLAAYWLWHRVAVRRALKAGKPPPHFRDGPFYWAVIASLLVAVFCFLWFGAQLGEHKGNYVPPQMKDGVLIPGHVE